MPDGWILEKAALNARQQNTDQSRAVFVEIRTSKLILHEASHCYVFV